MQSLVACPLSPYETTPLEYSLVLGQLAQGPLPAGQDTLAHCLQPAHSQTSNSYPSTCLVGLRIAIPRSLGCIQGHVEEQEIPWQGQVDPERVQLRRGVQPGHVPRARQAQNW